MNSLGRTTIVAVAAALIGGGVGGGIAAVTLNHNQTTESASSVPTKQGSAKISNVDVKVNSDYTSAFNKVKGSVVSVINMQKAQSNSDGLDSFGSLFGGSGSGNSGNSGSNSESGSSSSNGKSSSGNLEENSEGSGVIYKKDGDTAYVVTNNHVVSGSDKLEIILSDGTKIDGDLVGTDSVSDLAVVKIKNSKVSSITPSTFGNSESIQTGEPVIAIGSPLGSEYATSVTQGIVSAKSRTIPVQDEKTGVETGEQTVIQTDAAINPGNSGGPLVNMGGQVIGINSMKLAGSTDGTSVEGMGFAIPSNQVVNIIDQLVANGKVSRPALGVSVLDLTNVSASQQKSVLKLPTDVKSGVVVGSVNSDSPAKAAGMKKYDVITKLGDKTITSVADLHTQLYKYKVGDTVKVSFYRDGKQQTATVHLTKSDNSGSSSNTGK